MSPSTPTKKRVKAASRRRDTLRTPSPSLPSPPKTPVSSRSHRSRASVDSKAARALLRLRSKLRRRSDTASSSPTSKGQSSSTLLPAPVIADDHQAGSQQKKKSPSTSRANKGAQETVPLGDVIEISSDETEKYTAPTRDDSEFRGRSSQSRVKTTTTRDPPLRTRGYFKRTGSTLDDEPKRSDSARKSSTTKSDDAGAKDDGNSDLDDNRDVTPELSEGSTLPEMSEFLKTLRKKKSDRVAVSESEDFSAGEYDSEDSFIDDDDAEVRSHDGAEDSVPSDEEAQLQLATFQSIISKLSPHLPQDKYDEALLEATRAFRMTYDSSPSHKRSTDKKQVADKGKRKAPSSVMDDTAYPYGEEPDEGQGTVSTSHARKKGKTSVRNVTANTSTPQGTSTPSVGTSNVASTAPAPPSTPHGHASTSNNTVPSTPVATPTGPVTFETLLAQTPGATGTPTSNVKYLQRIERLPAESGIELPENLDPILGGDYANLPNLVKGNITPWTSTRGRPHPEFQQWGSLIPKMNATLALAIVRFTDVGKYINPSRISPLEVHLKEIPTVPPRYQVVRNRRPVYCVTLGAVSRSQLFSRSNVGLRQKSINIRGHPVEWPRWEGFTCMVSGHNPISGQYGMNSIQIATKSDMTKKGNETTPIYTDEWTIDSDDQVPVYDARESPEFNFLSDVSDIENHLPMWDSANGEIPRESCVAVAYSMVFFFSQTSQAWTVGCNIRWVLVLGVPQNRVVP